MTQDGSTCSHLNSIMRRIILTMNFIVLHATVALEKYEALKELSTSRSNSSFHAIAGALHELNIPLRMIAVELADAKIDPGLGSKIGLTAFEVDRLTYRYIGVSGGYLGDFSYNTHAEFYRDLNLPIDPYQYLGTTRERFRHILLTSRVDWQARILEGILSRFPAGSAEQRTVELAKEIGGWSSRLRGVAVSTPILESSSEIVVRALQDAEKLLEAHNPVSAVDRVHTALHGHLRHILKQANIQFEERASLSALLTILKKDHPKFSGTASNASVVRSILRSLATILDSLNQIRNEGSVAHPNDNLVDEQEAMLIVNIGRSILAYLDGSLRS